MAGTNTYRWLSQDERQSDDTLNNPLTRNTDADPSFLLEERLRVVHDGEVTVNGEGHERELHRNSRQTIGVEEDNAQVGSVQASNVEIIQREVDSKEHATRDDTPEDVENERVVRMLKTADA